MSKTPKICLLAQICNAMQRFKSMYIIKIENNTLVSFMTFLLWIPFTRRNCIFDENDTFTAG